MRKKVLMIFIAFSLFEATNAQKGEKSIAAGVIIAFPDNSFYYSSTSWNIGVGLEGTGQYNFTEKSAFLMQLELTRFSGNTFYGSSVYHMSIVNTSLKGGYKYKFTTSGFYANLLVGIEKHRFYLEPVIALGAGKRFTVKDIYFIDSGIDYTAANINRYNIKAVFSLLRSTRKN